MHEILESLFKYDPKERASYKDIAKYPEISQHFKNIPGVSKQTLIQERLARVETRIKNILIDCLKVPTCLASPRNSKNGARWNPI